MASRVSYPCKSVKHGKYDSGHPKRKEKKICSCFVQKATIQNFGARHILSSIQPKKE
jgi:hypothetical protein